MSSKRIQNSDSNKFTGLCYWSESELDPKPVSVLGLVSNQTVELKPDSGGKMASAIDIVTQFIEAFFFTFS